MEATMFAKEQNEEFQNYLTTVEPQPYVIDIVNETGCVQPVSLLDKRYGNPGIVITPPLDLTYQELCDYFLQPITIGMIAVDIVAYDREDIVSFMKFDFYRKDPGKVSHNPIILYDDPEKFVRFLFRPVELLIKPLTYINFSLPKGAEIQLMLYRQKDFGN